MDTLTALDTQTRFENVERIVTDAGIAFIINSSTHCQCCTDFEDLGLDESDSYVFAHFGMGNGMECDGAEVSWDEGRLYISNEMELHANNCGDDCVFYLDDETEDFHTQGEGCVEGYPEMGEVFEEWYTLYFRHNGVETAQVLFDAFTANGFNAEWDGTAEKVVTLKLR